MNLRERQAVIRELGVRYRAAGKREKGRIVAQAQELLGYNRSYAARALRSASQPTRKNRPPRRRCQGRKPIYDESVKEALRQVWAVMSFPAGKRLAPFMAQIVPSLERHGELDLTPGVRQKLLQMSAATIDRLLAHDGGNSRGDFAQTLDMVDVATQWTETVAVPNKAQRWVLEALQRKLPAFPFPILGIDSDNGSEFINHHLLRFCAAEQITFTRSRTTHKNDNCHVEQKNWAVVRRMVGYIRYDTPEQLQVLNALYDRLRLYSNFFQPAQRLVSKKRNGAKVRKVYDTPKTPYQRVLASPDVPEEQKAALTQLYPTLNPAALRREISDLQQELIDLALKTPVVLSAGTREVPQGRVHFFLRQRITFQILFSMRQHARSAGSG